MTSLLPPAMPTDGRGDGPSHPRPRVPTAEHDAPRMAAAPPMTLGRPGQATAELYRLLVERAQDYAIFALDPTS